MTNSSARRKPLADVIAWDDAPVYKPKERRCLNCEGNFTSMWAGERICKPCKQTSSWRTGIAPKPAGTR